ncbi:PLP-dependent cysteine synthase family protein [Methylobacterium oryzihabitans]|uniref:L-cysteine desulfhydrase Cds1 n=1 Tax=Methylobacterium oryzihabitans TaxID=2499852 RepID=A0A3S2VEM6_9HYPH|nr:PLP-dependent cysteine synthase family protein [Methylobacterium oryzihabitans]RVU21153.1 PLP-dependent cysteine synthase family protein [Methylobacterium oryzihabitans]
MSEAEEHRGGPDRAWIAQAIEAIEADVNRSADTHLLRLPLPACPGISLYVKDESTHPTGSLKHRLARSLFLYALCSGRIGPGTTIVESSSGSTAVSEAYFARMLGLPFVAVMPRTTSAEKVAQIARYGGRCHFVDGPGAVYAEAERLAASLGGHYMDQFTYAERATDWRGNNNIAESIFAQMAREPQPVPAWIVVGAGTGGTSATIGRFLRYRRLPTRLCLADPSASVFHRHLADPSVCTTNGPSSLIEGIGRGRCEPSFLPEIIDRAEAVSDPASLAAARVLSDRLGRSCGGSTGTNLWAAARVIAGMAAAGETGSVVTLLCDSGERYRSTHADDAWLAGRGIVLDREIAAVEAFFAHGTSPDAAQAG